MSKKHRRNNRRQRYSIDQFVNVLCRGCNLCDAYVNPKVCFEKAYKTNPRGFIENVYKKLIRLRVWPFAEEETPAGLKKEREIFKNIFCSSGCCTPQKSPGSNICEKLDECFDEFRWQIIDSDDAERPIAGLIYTNRGEKKKKRKDKGKRVIVQPYPTFIARNNEEFQKAIRRIIYGEDENANDLVEQDRTKELSVAACAGNFE